MKIGRRESSIEALRCLLMFFIVLWHARFYGIWPNEDQSIATRFVFGVFLCWHVDCFVAISGWFGMKFAWRKLAEILGLMGFVWGLSGVVHGVEGVRTVMFRPGASWFVGVYIMLLFLSPLLNAGIEHLYRQSPKHLLRAWLLFALSLTMDWMPGLDKLALAHQAGQGGGEGIQLLQ